MRLSTYLYLAVIALTGSSTNLSNTSCCIDSGSRIVVSPYLSPATPSLDIANVCRIMTKCRIIRNYRCVYIFDAAWRTVWVNIDEGLSTIDVVSLKHSCYFLHRRNDQLSLSKLCSCSAFFKKRSSKFRMEISWRFLSFTPETWRSAEDSYEKPESPVK